MCLSLAAGGARDRLMAATGQPHLVRARRGGAGSQVRPLSRHPSPPSLCPVSPGGRRAASVHFLQEGLQPELLLKAGGWGDLQRVLCGAGADVGNRAPEISLPRPAPCP